ncbi:MAG: hypothetical protein AAF411_22590, partial [Myxococcota bacterium]
GHDRSVREVVDCAIQEDASAIAITSYQEKDEERPPLLLPLYSRTTKKTKSVPFSVCFSV